jgi:hypothetical protein
MRVLLFFFGWYVARRCCFAEPFLPVAFENERPRQRNKTAPREPPTAAATTTGTLSEFWGVPLDSMVGVSDLEIMAPDVENIADVCDMFDLLVGGLSVDLRAKRWDIRRISLAYAITVGGSVQVVL